MSEHNSTERGAAPADPFVALRAADTPGWTDPIAPDAEFAHRLRDRLERGATLPTGVVMSTDISTTDISSTIDTTDTPTVERPGALPYLTIDGARAAVDWYVAHLGATLRGEPIVMDDGRIGHAELEIGGGVIYVADQFEDMGLRGPQPGHVSVSLMLPVDDTDAAVAAARNAGASVTREPYEGYGTRTGTIIDPFGHRWMLTGPSKAGAPLTGRIHVGDIVYMSLQTPDVDRAVRFYGSVLGWEYDPSTRQVTNLGHRLGISQAGDYGSNTLYCVYAVDDFETARAAIVAAGGSAGDVGEVSRDGTRVVDAVDDQGVAFSVHVPASDERRPDQHPRGVGEMSYLTVHTADSARFRAFYGAALGWTFHGGRIDDGWEVDDVRPQIGIAGGAERSAAVPMWNVDDMDSALARLRSAGGRVITEPDTQAYGMMAHCADDQGTEFYLGQLF
ncbi:VOC family protein [Gordonia sp. ABSL11-1]|uniref:VOC family protein n=1 Tax=Gordonia sp. ABSL11-1 TaxID=3053924 RepID=UPI0025730992|nr:VOC family protein [Gordonia sp. ABSL11-1]MDL9945460.1 VOC family protein [Gordonia sp. ABSL11-1]